MKSTKQVEQRLHPSSFIPANTFSSVQSSLKPSNKNSAPTPVLQRSAQSGFNFAHLPLFHSEPPAAIPTNETGLPDALKASVENLSGFSLADVRVHYRSSKPAAMKALAYTQGTQIYVGAGQERSLPHEAWHVVQQMQGRVSSDRELPDSLMNTDSQLEQEADHMGTKAAYRAGQENRSASPLQPGKSSSVLLPIIQRNREGGEPESRYSPDRQGLPSLAESAVGRVEGIRNESAQAFVSGRINLLLDTVFAGSKKEQYHAGHLITRHLGGLGDTLNLVPVPHNYNTDIGIKKNSTKLGEEGYPKHWGEEYERYSDFEARVDQLAAQVLEKEIKLALQVQVGYGPDNQDAFLANILSKKSLSLVDLPQGGVDLAIWQAALRALYQHLYFTLRTIPFNIRAVLYQGTLAIAAHTGNVQQLFQLNEPWEISVGFLNNLATALNATKIQSAGDIEKILSALCGYTGLKADLPQYFDESSRRSSNQGPRDYDVATNELIAQGPPPGIQHRYTEGGVARGIDAFIWMDPKKTVQYRYGGSPPSVSPRGFTWSVLQRARPGLKSVVDQKQMYVRAHLLNHRLHGPGNDPDNLVPLVDAANTRMEQGFESIVKNHSALYREFVNPPAWNSNNQGSYMQAPWLDTWYGVTWSARCVGNVARPADYMPLALQAALPANPAAILAREEAKMPQYLEMQAWEARATRQSPTANWAIENGNQIAFHREWNSMNGGNVLEETNPGTGIEDPSIKLAQSMARTRTFSCNSATLLNVASSLPPDNFVVGEEKNYSLPIQDKKTGQSFSIEVTPRGLSMTDVRIVSNPKKAPALDPLDDLADEVRFLDMLESRIPVIDTKALAEPEDPQTSHKQNALSAQRMLKELSSVLGPMQAADPYKTLMERVNFLANMLDIADLGTEDTIKEALTFQEEKVMMPLLTLRFEVMKALAGTGISLEETASWSGKSFGNASGAAFSPFGSPYGAPKKGPSDGSVVVGMGYVLSLPTQNALKLHHRANVDIMPDGDCLFASLIAMNAFHGTVQQMRTFVAGKIRDGSINVAPFNLNPAVTATEIETPGSYNNLAGDATPSIIAQALNINLLIFNENGTTTALSRVGAAKTFYLIRFTTPGAHYHATHSTMG